MLNEKEFEFLGIARWHEKGYKGRNVIIASRENVLNVFNDVEAYTFEKSPTEWAKHGTNVMDYIRQVAPDARKITFEFHGVMDEIFTSPHSKYILDIVPDILTTSLFNSEYKGYPLKFYTTLYKQDCFLTCAAGNSGDSGVRQLAQGDMWKAIGACRYNKGKPKVTSYSSKGEELDFVSFDHLIAKWSGYANDGTSFSVPLFASMLALVQSFFIEKTGHKLNNDELMNFAIDNTIDLDKDGKDIKSGYGLFVLPDPDTIDVFKYTKPIVMEDVFQFLQDKGELLEPSYWQEQIQREDKFKWLFIKWANAVRFSRGLAKNQNEIYDYNVEPILNWLHNNGYLYEPDYWITKILKEPKLRWMFYKWYNAINRVR